MRAKVGDLYWSSEDLDKHITDFSEVYFLGMVVEVGSENITEICLWCLDRREIGKLHTYPNKKFQDWIKSGEAKRI